MTDERGSIATRAAPLAVAVVVVALAAAAAGAFPALSASDAPPDGAAVLERVDQRYANAESIAGEATVTVGNDTVERSANVSFVLERPNATRLAVSHNGTEVVTGTNGSVAWISLPAVDVVRVWDLPENASAWNHTGGNDSVWNGTDWNHTGGNRTAVPGNATGAYATPAGTTGTPWAAWNGTDWNHTGWNHTDWDGSHGNWSDGNATAELLRTTTVDGRKAYVVGLDPANDSRPGNATLWVDAEEYSVLKYRATVGEYRTAVDVDGVRFNVSLHESTFRPPDGASVTAVAQTRFDTFDAAQAGTDITLHRLDAEGYAFESATEVTRAGQTVVAQRYAGGANATVVATAGEVPGLNATAGESVTVAGANATYVERGDRSAVVWETDDGVTRAVVGDLPRERLVELAEAVRS